MRDAGQHHLFDSAKLGCSSSIACSPAAKHHTEVTHRLVPPDNLHTGDLITERHHVAICGCPQQQGLDLVRVGLGTGGCTIRLNAETPCLVEVSKAFFLLSILLRRGCRHA